MRKLFSLKIESLTPISQSSVDEQKCDEWGLRGSTMRGLLRWWLRALVGGVLYDHCFSDHDIIKNTKLIENFLFGTTSRSSIVNISIKSNIRRIDQRSLSRLYRKTRNRLQVEHIRLQLILMGIKSPSEMLSQLQQLLCEISAEITFSSSIISSNGRLIIDPKGVLSINIEYLDKLILYLTILTIILGGFGKGARRGLGSFKIKEIVPFENNLKSTISDIIDGLEKNFLDQLKSIINRAYELIEKIFGLNKNVECQCKSELPPFPVISKCKTKIYYQTIQSQNNTVQRLIDLNNIILKKLFLRMYNTNYNANWQPEGLAEKLQGLSPHIKRRTGKTIWIASATQVGSFILGLPREAKINKQQLGVYKFDPFDGRGDWYTMRYSQDLRGYRTGYASPKIFKGTITSWEQFRRASPIIVSLATEEYVLITFMKSKDWPKELWWFTEHKKQIRPLTIDDALDFVDMYLSREYKKLWP